MATVARDWGRYRASARNQCASVQPGGSDARESKGVDDTPSPPRWRWRRRLIRGLRALCGIAAYYRIGADPVQLQRELALGERLSRRIRSHPRGAELIGMRARLVDRRRRAPDGTPADARDRSAAERRALSSIAGRAASGLCRLVDPISHAATEIPLDELARETGGRALLVARRFGGAGVIPKTFWLRWFLPTLWRYRQPARACAGGLAVRSDLRPDRRR